MRNMRCFSDQYHQRNAKFFFVLILLVLSMAQTGCIRLWGGATYIKTAPGETVQKTYLLDTYEITSHNPPNANIQ